MGRKKGSKNKPKQPYGNEVGDLKIHEQQPPILDADDLTGEFVGYVPTENDTIGDPQYAGRGIVILALGNPQYGRMAANLAASIRYSDKDIPINLYYSGLAISHLTDHHKALFTSIEFCSPKYYYKGGKEVYLKAKTHLYDLSPFEETIFIDADMVWFGKKTVTSLFESLKDVDFTFQNRGFADLSADKLDEKFCQWCNIREVRDTYQTKGRFYHLASEFIYFKRSESNREFFELAKEIFNNPKIAGFTFGGDLPDEFAFDIAAAVLNKYPHQDNFVPVYWFRADKKLPTNDIMQKYFGYSIGGNGMPDSVMRTYDDMCKFYAKALKLPFHYKIQHKRQWLPERKSR